MQTRPLILSLAVLTLILLSPLGGSLRANPVDSDPEDSVVNREQPHPIPNYLSITQIRIESFPNRKPNASHWDRDEDRAKEIRPDPFVVITSPRGRLWQSDYLENKISRPTSVYRLRLNGKISFTMNTTYTFTVFDRDESGAEEMGSVTFRAIDAFEESPADHEATVTISSDKITITMHGIWKR